VEERRVKGAADQSGDDVEARRVRVTTTRQDGAVAMQRRGVRSGGDLEVSLICMPVGWVRDFIPR
jgi:hypothetical protein